MESVISTQVEDGLLSALSFKHPGQLASYITESRMTSFQAESGDRFSTSARQIRFRLLDPNFIEASSHRIQFDINNLDASNSLIPIAQPLAMCGTPSKKASAVSLPPAGQNTGALLVAGA